MWFFVVFIFLILFCDCPLPLILLRVPKAQHTSSQVMPLNETFCLYTIRGPSSELVKPCEDCLLAQTPNTYDGVINEMKFHPSILCTIRTRMNYIILWLPAISQELICYYFIQSILFLSFFNLSNVVEKCIVHASRHERAGLIDEICSSPEGYVIVCTMYSVNLIVFIYYQTSVLGLYCGLSVGYVHTFSNE